MENIFSNTVYSDIAKLEQKFLAISQRISPENADIISEKINNIKEKLENIDVKEFYLKQEIVKEIVDLEMNYLTEEKVKAMLKNGVIQSLVEQLNAIENFVNSDLDKVREFLDVFESKWNSIKHGYSDIEKAKVDRKFADVAVKVNIETIKTTGKVDMSKMSNICNSQGYYSIVQMLIQKGKKLNGLEKAKVESWKDESIDVNTGLINEERVKKLINDCNFWQVMSGNHNLTIDEPVVIEETVERKTREEQIYEISEYFHISDREKLIPKKKNDVVIYTEIKNSKVSRVIKQLPRNRVYLLDKDIWAVIMNENVSDDIPNNAFSRHTHLTRVVLPNGIKKIGEKAFLKQH